MSTLSLKTSGVYNREIPAFRQALRRNCLAWDGIEPEIIEAAWTSEPIRQATGEMYEVVCKLPDTIGPHDMELYSFVLAEEGAGDRRGYVVRLYKYRAECRNNWTLDEFAGLFPAT